MYAVYNYTFEQDTSTDQYKIEIMSCDYVIREKYFEEQDQNV